MLTHVAVPPRLFLPVGLLRCPHSMVAGFLQMMGQEGREGGREGGMQGGREKERERQVGEAGEVAGRPTWKL